MILTLCRYYQATMREMLEVLSTTSGPTILNRTYACGLFAEDPEFCPYVYALNTSYASASRHRRTFAAKVLRGVRGEALKSTKAAPSVFAGCYRDWTMEYGGKQAFKALLVAPQSMPTGTTREQKAAHESLLRQFGELPAIRQGLSGFLRHFHDLSCSAEELQLSDSMNCWEIVGAIRYGIDTETARQEADVIKSSFDMERYTEWWSRSAAR